MREHATHAPSAKKVAEPVAHQTTSLGGNRDYLPTAAPATHVQGAPPPRPAAASLTSGPVQAKKGKEQEPAPIPLSQKVILSKSMGKEFAGIQSSERDETLRGLDNVGQRFEALKKSNDTEALYDFMRKAASLTWTTKSHQKGATNASTQAFKSGLTSMMADPIFASEGFKTYMSKNLKEGLAQFAPAVEEVEGMSRGSKKFDAKADLYSKPEAHKFFSSTLAYAGLSPILQGTYNRDFSFNEDQNLTPKQWDMIYHVGLDYGGNFSKGPTGGDERYGAGDQMFFDDMSEIMAPLEETPVQDTKARKRHRFRR